MLPPPITTATCTPEPHDLADFGDDAVDDLAIDAVGIVAHQRFARKLEQDALVRRLRCRGSGATSDSRRDVLRCSSARFVTPQ